MSSDPKKLDTWWIWAPADGWVTPSGAPALCRSEGESPEDPARVRCTIWGPGAPALTVDIPPGQLQPVEPMTGGEEPIVVVRGGVEYVRADFARKILDTEDGALAVVEQVRVLTNARNGEGTVDAVKRYAEVRGGQESARYAFMVGQVCGEAQSAGVRTDDPVQAVRTLIEQLRIARDLGDRLRRDANDERAELARYRALRDEARRLLTEER